MHFTPATAYETVEELTIYGLSIPQDLVVRVEADVADYGDIYGIHPCSLCVRIKSHAKDGAVVWADPMLIGAAYSDALRAEISSRLIRDNDLLERLADDAGLTLTHKSVA